MARFEKKLTKTDQGSMLVVPTRFSRNHLPLVEGGRSENITVVDVGGTERSFGYYVRRHRNPRPVLRSGWRRYVLEKGLKVGDRIIFERVDGFPELYRIGARRRITLFGQKLLYEAAVKNALDLAIHEKGCVNLKNFISSSRGPGRGQLLQVIAESCVFLSQDPFGNFVVQLVLELEIPIFSKEICSRLKGHFVKISMQKAGSHVVEKCLMSRGMELVVQDFIDCNQLQHVIKDQYGNYVIETALKVTMVKKSPLFDKLAAKLLQHRNVMMKGHGRRVQKCLNLAGVLC